MFIHVMLFQCIRIKCYPLVAGEAKELLHHGRRAGKEEKIEIRVVSGETNLIIHSLHKANVFTLLKYL